jgi:CspA family cold shock protein
MSTSSSTDNERFNGRVKWFNNKSGYGFITVTDGSKSGTDVFVHHNAVHVSTEQYKYLVQGEYVNFKLTKTTTDNHEFQADDVCGVNGGKLMCETRNENRVSRSQYVSTNSSTKQPMQKAREDPPPSRTSTTRTSQNTRGTQSGRGSTTRQFQKATEY